jgi:hypothetical protein
MTLRISAIAVSVAGLAALAGCGGGGGSSGSSGAQANLMSAAAPAQPMSVGSTTLKATDNNGNAWTVVYAAMAGGTAMFNGQTANTTAIAITISENGVVAATEDSTAYYMVNPYSPLGISGTTNGMAWTAVINGYTPFPAMLTVGDSGQVSSATYYDGMNNVIGSLTETYTVTANNVTSLLLNIDAAGTLNGVQETETLTYVIGSDGTFMGLQGVQLTVNGTTLTFTPG